LAVLLLFYKANRYFQQPSTLAPIISSAKKILIIEDTPEIRHLVSETLRSRGFRTVAAEDGLRGVELAVIELPDLILCDVQMPNLDGHGTLTALREQPATEAIPFIFLTGLSDRPNVRYGMDLGADDYLTKPFTVEELLGAVQTRLAKQELLSRRSEAKLEELRENIAYALPHELMTPLNGILGFTTPRNGFSEPSRISYSTRSLS
jgi:two-component system sensor histidine kinase/response regulator